jgi:hypothetical protein
LPSLIKGCPSTTDNNNNNNANCIPGGTLRVLAGKNRFFVWDPEKNPDPKQKSENLFF